MELLLDPLDEGHHGSGDEVLIFPVGRSPSSQNRSEKVWTLPVGIVHCTSFVRIPAAFSSGDSSDGFFILVFGLKASAWIG